LARMRIPSMTALRAFEAVARTLSFRQAADELSVTHSAVSHQIKALELEFGRRLFERDSRNVVMTDAGKLYYPIVRESLDALARGTERISNRHEPEVLMMQSYGSFVGMWLTPRLPSFQQAHPDVRVRVISSFEDFGVEGYDVGIFKGPNQDNRLAGFPLFKTEMFPVCAPGLLDAAIDLREPAEVAGHKLLNIPANADEPADWDLWLDAAGLSPDCYEIGPTFDNYPIAREAALAGLGFVMARQPFVADDLKAGRLIRPFSLVVPEPGSWFIFLRRQVCQEPSVLVFREWIQSEIERDPNFIHIHT